VDTRDKLLGRFFDAAARIKMQDRLRRKTRDVRMRVVNFIEVGGGNLERLL